MRTYAHHHVDTPHGDSHPTISPSVLISCLFLGIQGIVWVVTLVLMPMGPQPVATIFGAGSPMAGMSMIIALLLLVFLGLDYWRNRMEAHGSNRYQYVAFAVAVAVMADFVYFLSLTMR